MEEGDESAVHVEEATEATVDVCNVDEAQTVDVEESELTIDLRNDVNIKKRSVLITIDIH